MKNETTQTIWIHGDAYSYRYYFVLYNKVIINTKHVLSTASKKKKTKQKRDPPNWTCFRRNGIAVDWLFIRRDYHRPNDEMVFLYIFLCSRTVSGHTMLVVICFQLIDGNVLSHETCECDCDRHKYWRILNGAVTIFIPYKKHLCKAFAWKRKFNREGTNVIKFMTKHNQYCDWYLAC